jgi:folate-binding protein YgfZ
MSQITHLVGTRTYTFTGLRELLTKASPARSGDYLAGVAAGSAEERVAAQMALADLPLTTFLNEVVVPYETDEVTRLIVDGLDAAAFLQGQLSSDVAGLEVGATQHTSYNSPGGRMLANFTLWHDAEGSYRARLDGGVAEAVRKRLSMFVLRSKVKIADVTATSAIFGVGGPRAIDAVRAALGAAPAPFRTAPEGVFTILGFPGPRFLVVAPAAAADQTRGALGRSARLASPAAWQWLLIHGGLPVITQATQDKFVPQTANWDALGGISFQKGCYTGQEIIARTQYLGRLKERLFAFHAADAGAAAGDRLYSPAFPDQPCGTVVNAAPAPGGGMDLLAVLQLAAVESGDVRLNAAEGVRLAPLPLPYALPAPTARPRVAR